jgi:hypothetical protein
MRTSDTISVARFADVWCVVLEVMLGWELDDLNETCMAAALLCQGRAVSWSGTGAMQQSWGDNHFCFIGSSCTGGGHGMLHKIKLSSVIAEVVSVLLLSNSRPKLYRSWAAGGCLSCKYQASSN